MNKVFIEQRQKLVRRDKRRHFENKFIGGK
jgi:hypothetical protein